MKQSRRLALLLSFLALLVTGRTAQAQPFDLSVRLVKDINPGPASSTPFLFANVNGVLFFAANDGVHGRELWKSDGTAAGTVLVKDIDPGPVSSLPFNLINVNGVL